MDIEKSRPRGRPKTRTKERQQTPLYDLNRATLKDLETLSHSTGWTLDQVILILAEDFVRRHGLRGNDGRLNPKLVHEKFRRRDKELGQTTYVEYWYAVEYDELSDEERQAVEQDLAMRRERRRAKVDKIMAERWGISDIGKSEVRS